MAVPYEACDLPSQRSEYKHPDTAIVLTLLSYYQVGLSKAALCDVVRGLGTLPDGKRNTKYKYAPSSVPAPEVAMSALTPPPLPRRGQSSGARKWFGGSIACVTGLLRCRAMFALGAADASPQDIDALSDVDEFGKIDIDNTVQFHVRGLSSLCAAPRCTASSAACCNAFHDHASVLALGLSRLCTLLARAALSCSCFTNSCGSIALPSTSG